MTDNLVAFLRARRYDDERTAHATLWDGSGNTLNWDLPASATVSVGEDEFYAGDRTIANHIARHDPARVLREVEVDRELLREYEQLLRAHDAHKAAVAELTADIEHGERAGRWEGVGSPDIRQRALRREADYLPAMIHMMEKWAKGKAAVHDDHPDYRDEWRP